jgi:hypothetical protein
VLALLCISWKANLSTQMTPRYPVSLPRNNQIERRHQGALIPVGEDISRFEVDDDISWVLIVEKEVWTLFSSLLRILSIRGIKQAVFQTLCRLKLASHPSLPGPGIVITVIISFLI